MMRREHKFEAQKDEKVLIEELRKGNERAFTELYHRYFQRVYVYCLQFSKSRCEAEDVAQEVFVQLWCNRRKITSHDSVKALIFVIARNFLVRAYRRNINSPIMEDYVTYCNSLGGADSPDIEYHEFVNAVMRCVDELPQAQQRVVRLSRFGQLSNKEIALRLGINEQSVKNHLSKGLKFLRKKMEHIICLSILFLSGL